MNTKPKASIRQLMIGASVLASLSVEAQAVQFEDVSQKLDGFIHSSNPPPFSGEGVSGSAWLDYDNDGDLDLFMTNGVGFSNALYRNDDGEFTDVTNESGLFSSTGNSAVVAGDIDNDGYVDLFLTGEGFLGFARQTPTYLYRNNGDGTFSDISSTANLPGAETALMAAMGDINNDGYLDIFITSPGHLDVSARLGLPAGVFGGPAIQHQNRLYLNNKDLTFTDISESAGVNGDLGACVVSFHDYERDGDLDIYVGNCNDVSFRPTPFHLYRNNGDLTFTDVAEAAGLDLPGFWMAVAFGDIDNDGDEDLFATNAGPSPSVPADEDPFHDFRQHALFLNNGDGTYTDIADELDMADREFSWGASFADYNNDGYQDLFFTGALPLLGAIGEGWANPGRLYINDKQGGFTESDQSATGGNFSNRYTSGLAKADYNADGLIDLLVKTETLVDASTGTVLDLGTPVLLQNTTQTNNRSLTVKLSTSSGQATAVGARIDLYTLSGRQVRTVYAGSSFASSESPWPTFGTGKRRWASLWVTWPDGDIEFFGWRKTRGSVDLKQGEGYFTYRNN